MKGKILDPKGEDHAQAFPDLGTARFSHGTFRFGLLAGAVLTLAGLWLGPLPTLARHAFFAHMALHMGVVAIAAPLLSFAVADTRFDPVCKWPAFFPPIPISVVELVVVWTWHAPALHHAARHNMVGLFIEQGAFLVAGVAVWIAAFGGGPVRRYERAGAGVAALLLTSMHMTLLGALLALSPRTLYAHAHFSDLTPLDDQHLGGAIMLIVGGISYLAGGLWLTAGLIRGADKIRRAGT